MGTLLMDGTRTVRYIMGGGLGEDMCGRLSVAMHLHVCSHDLVRVSRQT